MRLVTLMRGYRTDEGFAAAGASVASCLIATLLASACGLAAPRAALPETVSPTERAACEELARRVEAQVHGSSIAWGAAIGAVAGGGMGVYGAARADATADEDAGVVIAAFVGGFAAIGALVGGGAVAVRNARLQRAARDETLGVCLRPAALSATYGPAHPEVASSLHALAFRYYRVGDLARAEPLLARALAIQEQHFGADAPEVAAILEDYASVLRHTGRAAEGEALEQRARAIRSRR
jgi:hypothetical protein